MLAWQGLRASLGSLAGKLEVRTWVTWGGTYARGWRPGKPVVWRPNWSKSAFWHTGNTGTYALEAAASIGFRDLRMLGIDMRFDLKKSHFFGENLHRGKRITYTPRAIASKVKGFKIVVEGLRGLGCTVTNESAYDGPLDAFIPRRECPWLRKS